MVLGQDGPLCPICKLTFYGRQNRILCVICKLYVHCKCAGISTTEEYNAAAPTFKCRVCSGSDNLSDGNSHSSKSGVTGNNADPPTTTTTKSTKSASVNSNVKRTVGVTDWRDLPTTDIVQEQYLPMILNKLNELSSEVKSLRNQVGSLTAKNTELTNTIQKLLHPTDVPPGRSNGPPPAPAPSYLSVASRNTTTQYRPGPSHRNDQFRVEDDNVFVPAAHASNTPMRNFLNSETSNYSNQSDDGFTVVKNKRQRRGQKKSGGVDSPRLSRTQTPRLKTTERSKRPPSPLIGENTDSSLQVIERPGRIKTKSLFVSRFSPETTVDDIKDYLSRCLSLLGEVKVSRLATRFSNYTSFHVEVPEKDFPLINNTSIWPRGALIKSFRGRLTPEKCFTEQPQINQADNHSHDENVLSSGDMSGNRSDSNQISQNASESGDGTNST